ncbi:homoserine dehydrogenase [Nitrosococcus oceani ATCC 19707]|uniref:Homoserine dehydrogenase n=2 Tax=Nitrosococcus oceani TaxID=1229 RepID=Q3J8D9_NITOC|nr:homoserine dehydrogenase [Nitrosococcus oceani]ABA58907.1 homoserine dehydrogenase [Nitrosococcus oceani ATCC 19707]EDZ66757.1 Homoserine dehydrogenase, NAD binding domain family [Nitrosococcus oceani AFC27]KFI18707.1 homoserine dehydrogenase [Nitrosococcus oceani C-27]GEM18997.1 homoserine dehydrogenase [Nitrosococcus oceani]
MEPVKVGLLGLGTVGGGTVNVLSGNAEEITRRAGRGIQVYCAATRDSRKARSCDTEGIWLTTNPHEVVADPQIEIIVELIGGTDLARTLVLKAIAEGKHVVTANKALIALYGNEIFEAAQKAGVMVAFEAAVGGGIPIIKALREGLAGNHIEWLAGIINGTSNFILTEMRDKGCDFAEALVDAQHRGYAEANPTFDIEGIDAAHKLTILASIAFGIPLQFEQVYTEGIGAITREDIDYAGQLGYRIKHLGIARRLAEGVELRVHPTLIPYRRLIANVEGVMNAILVKGDAVGSTLYYGPGAGADPTASAVVADLVDVVRALTSDPENRVPHLAFQPDALVDLPILSMEEVKTAYYLRMRAMDEPGVLAEVTRVFGDQSISIEAILQKEPAAGENHVPIIMLTQPVLERNMNEAIRRIEALESIAGPVTRIRLETLC